MSAKLNNLAKALGLQFKGNTAYGISHGYAVSIYEQKDCKVLFIDAHVSDDKQLMKDELRRFIIESSKQYGIRSSALSPLGIKVAFDNRLGVVNNIADFFEVFALSLKKHGIPGCEVCSNCRKPIVGETKLVNISGAVHACDAECAAKLSAIGTEHFPKSDKSGALAGGLGAFIGAAIGCAGFVAVSTYGINALWVGALVALFSKVGYYAFGGKSRVGDAVFTIIFSCLGICAAQFIVEGLDLSLLWKSQGYIFELKEPFIAALKAILRDTSVLVPYVTTCGIAGAISLLTLGALAGIINRKGSESTTVEVLQ